MSNVNRKDGIFIALSYFNAGPGCFVEPISTSRLNIVNRKNTSNTDKRITTEKKMIKGSKKGVSYAQYNCR